MIIKKKLLLLVMVSILTLTSCVKAPAPEISQPETTEVDAVSLLTSVAATNVASTPTSTLTPRPTFTSIPTVTAFPTFTPIPQSYLTPVSDIFIPTSVPCHLIRNLGGINIDAGEYILADTKFKMTWGFKNLGSCDIGPGYVLTFIDGHELGDEKGKLKTIVRYMENGKVSVDLEAPDDPGQYSARYMFKTPEGNFFGPAFDVLFIVPGTSCGPGKTDTSDYGLYVKYRVAGSDYYQFWSEKYWHETGTYTWPELYYWLVLYWGINPINNGDYGAAYCGEYDPALVDEYITSY